MCNCGGSGGDSGANAKPAVRGPLAPGYSSKAKTRAAELRAQQAAKKSS